MQVASTLVFTARLAPRYGRYSKKSTKRGGMIVHRGLGILQYDRHWRDVAARTAQAQPRSPTDRKSTRLNSSHRWISYRVFCLKKTTVVREFYRRNPPPQRRAFAEQRTRQN